MAIAEIAYSPRAVEGINREAEGLIGRGGGILAVCGLGGTGKTSACRELARRRSDTVILEIDWYLTHPTEMRRELITAALNTGNVQEIKRWEDPSSWYDWPGLLSGLEQLRGTNQLKIENAWRQATGKKDLSIEIHLPAPPWIILVDGIYLLHHPVRQVLDWVVVLETDLRSSTMRGQARDHHRSDSAYLQWKAKLAEEFDRPYFSRYAANADSAIVV